MRQRIWMPSCVYAYHPWYGYYYPALQWQEYDIKY